MLEEALTSPTFPPAEAALTLLTFIRYQLPAGGANAEARFLRLFALLSDRVFGKIIATHGKFQHEIGGWLARQDRWERPNRSAASSASTAVGSRGRGHSPLSSKSSSTIDKDPVVELLAGTGTSKSELPTMIDAISTEDENRPTVRFPFPFQALPKTTQDVFLELLQNAMSGKPSEKSLRANAARLASVLLRVHPRDQSSLKAYQLQQVQRMETKRPLTLSPGLALSPRRPVAPEKKHEEVAPQLMLTMLETYLFLFVHYALSPPSIQAQTTVGSPGITRHYQRQSESYGEQVYIHLFGTYVRHFLPLADTRLTFLGYQSLTREQELFLRIVIEFWIDGGSLVPTTTKATEPIRLRNQRAGMSGDITFDLSMSYDLVTDKYDPPPAKVVRCLRMLLNHAVKDPGIGRAVADANEVGPSVGQEQIPELTCCLSPCMTMLQLPFYNFLRTTFRYASIHATSSPFYAALDAWLIWIEPWNVTFTKNAVAKAKNAIASKVSNSPRGSQASQISTPVIVRPRAQSRSKYSKKWEPYIAANLHLYTVPLAVFLRRARELDFSPRFFRRSLELVQRVFRVFTPDVVHVINGLLNNEAHRLTSLVKSHDRNLGDYSPSSLGSLSLSSCRSHMHNVLEEMYSQHLKAMRELDIFDRLGAYLGVGDVTTSEEKEMRALVERARVIVSFPPDYVVIPSAKKTLTSREDESVQRSGFQPERDPSGLLTDRGRKDLTQGMARCSPADIVYLGDTMVMRPTSYEIKPLVCFTAKASNYLNRRLGLTTVEKQPSTEAHHSTADDSSEVETIAKASTEQKGWFRINLRFLADYRNLLFITVVVWVSSSLRH